MLFQKLNWKISSIKLHTSMFDCSDVLQKLIILVILFSRKTQAKRNLNTHCDLPVGITDSKRYLKTWDVVDFEIHHQLSIKNLTEAKLLCITFANSKSWLNITDFWKDNDTTGKKWTETQSFLLYSNTSKKRYLHSLDIVDENTKYEATMAVRSCHYGMNELTFEPKPLPPIWSKCRN